MKHTFFILAIISSFVPITTIAQDAFYTIDFQSPISVAEVQSGNIDVEAETYIFSDSVSAMNNIATSIVPVNPDSITQSAVQDIKEKANMQTLYYESLIDSLMYENFMLKMDLAVIEKKFKHLISAATQSEELPTGIAGHYQTQTDLTIESLIAEILKNGIKHPRVVLAQAILETGWFKSRVCHTHNNLFGLRQPWDGAYFKFKRWQDSVKAYRTKVQYKYKGGPYLRWLKDLGYAEDPNYTDKLKILLAGPLKDY